MEQFTEGAATIIASAGKISKQLSVFYNPVMAYNRTLSITLLRALGGKQLLAADPLAGSGIRGIRFLKELPPGTIAGHFLNDIRQEAAAAIRKNLRLNHARAAVCCQDARMFLLHSQGFDYIDIDPFGSPNPFLDAAVQRIRDKGILAVTCTDTASLSGTYPKTCLRKYWAVPSRTAQMHEIGLRILIRKAQLIGAQYDLALHVLFSYFKDHYFRIFFRCERSKEQANSLVREHGLIQGAGPAYLGRLWDSNIVHAMYQAAPDPFLRTIAAESAIPAAGFFDIHALCKQHKLPIPKTAALLAMLQEKGYAASTTIFSPYGIRTTAPESLVRLISRSHAARQ
ncbi:hypothetical protein HY491_01825 [Candidatus Woesearchaeota archaeon]|nr:hypothetical protein [Candidatus Woesearchaeota archaeon]